MKNIFTIYYIETIQSTISSVNISNKKNRSINIHQIISIFQDIF